MTNKTNLKLVDESFVENFLDGLSEDTKAPELITVDDDTPNPDPNPEPKPNNVLLKNTDSFSILDLVDETVDDNTPLSFNKKNSSNNNQPIEVEEPIAYINNLIEEGILFGFDEEDFKIKSYEDIKEIVLANKEEWKREILEKEFEETFQTLPNELQYAVKYVKEGGNDMKSLFKVLSQSEELKSLDPDKNPRETSRTYLELTAFGTPEEIEEQLDEWEDTDVLAKKAKMFHPKIEKIAEDKIQSKLIEEENNNKKRQQIAEQYFTGVSEALKDKNINGIVLTKDEQVSIYKSLTENNYISSRNGAPINFLGKFLEKITIDEPDYKTLAEITLFAKDPSAYREKIKAQAVEEVTADTTRKLKTGSSQIKSSVVETASDDKIKITKKVLAPRPNSILKRHN